MIKGQTVLVLYNIMYAKRHYGGVIHHKWIKFIYFLYKRGKAITFYYQYFSAHTKIQITYKTSINMV